MERHLPALQTVDVAYEASADRHSIFEVEMFNYDKLGKTKCLLQTDLGLHIQVRSPT